MTGRAPLRALLAASTVSVAGTAMTLLAVPWFVLETTGSAAQTGLAAAAEIIPLVLASALGGPFVDRVGARRASVLSDLASAVLVALVPLLHLTVGIAFWQLLVVIALLGLARAPGETARYVLLPVLAAQGDVPVERASSLYDGVSRGARMLGAPLAGVLIVVFEPTGVLLLDAITFLVSAAVLTIWVPADVRPSAAPTGEPYLAQLRRGFAYFRRDHLVGGITAMVMVTNLLDAGLVSVVLPVYARELLGGSVALGVVLAAFGAGALSGALLYGVVGPGLPRWPVFTVAFLLVGAPRFGVLAVEPSLAVIVFMQVACGLAAGSLNPILAAVEYERVPQQLQSRVFGASTAGVLVGMPVGALLAGLLVEGVGLRATLLGMGALYLAATVVPLLFPVWREMDAGRAERRPLERMRA